MKKRMIGTVALIAMLAIVMAPAAASAATSWPTLRSGSRGVDVRTVQHLLREWNADRTGDPGTLRVDGVYGGATRRAVMQFQRVKGLAADGVVGYRTWRALTPWIDRGERGQDVRALQEQIRFNQYSITVDGNYGPATERRVAQVERDNGLPVDGIADDNVWRELIGRTGD